MASRIERRAERPTEPGQVDAVKPSCSSTRDNRDGGSKVNQDVSNLEREVTPTLGSLIGDIESGDRICPLWRRWSSSPTAVSGPLGPDPTDPGVIGDILLAGYIGCPTQV
jgi:hypothetical protein